MDLERACAKDRTTKDWVAAVQRSVRLIRGSPGDEHPLRDLAHEALLSPFHFHRVFRQLTAATPARFLAAWRMAEAKRLLACSSTSVTEICMTVGYSSLGTFTSQFSRLVGVSPRRFRCLAATFSDESFDTVLVRLAQVLPPPERVQVVGRVTGGPEDGALAVVGLFRSGIPQERPAACAIVPVPGVATFGGLLDGVYHPLAMSFPTSVTAVEAMVIDDSERCFVGAGTRTVHITDGSATADKAFAIRLRRRTPIDPPVVLALPLLMAAEAVG